MKEMSVSITYLDSELNNLGSINEKISFLENFLKTNHHSRELLAYAYETLAYLNYKNSNPLPEIYVKAAHNWELSAFLKEGTKEEMISYQKQALKKALENYNMASRLFKNTNSSILAEEMLTKASILRKELHKFNNPIRTASIFTILLSFMLAILLILPLPTPAVIAPIESSGSSFLGIGFLVFGIIAGFLVWKYWY